MRDSDGSGQIGGFAVNAPIASDGSTGGTGGGDQTTDGSTGTGQVGGVTVNTPVASDTDPPTGTGPSGPQPAGVTPVRPASGGARDEGRDGVGGVFRDGGRSNVGGDFRESDGGSLIDGSLPSLDSRGALRRLAYTGLPLGLLLALGLAGDRGRRRDPEEGGDPATVLAKPVGRACAAPQRTPARQPAEIPLAVMDMTRGLPLACGASRRIAHSEPLRSGRRAGGLMRSPAGGC